MTSQAQGAIEPGARMVAGTGDNRDFLRALAHALAALALSALVLLASFAAFYTFQMPDGASNANSVTLAGSEFDTVMGTAHFDGDALVVSALQSQADGNHALVSRHVVFPAKFYPYMLYKLDGMQAGLQLQVFWRTAEQPGQMFAAPMPGNFGRATTLNLAAQSGWQGTITDLAIYLSGDLRNQALRIPAISLAPHRRQHLFAAVWSEWTAFRGWAPWSINYLQGTPGFPGTETLSPTLAAAAWTGLALSLLYLLGRLQRRQSTIAYGAVILVPWIALDLLWQGQLGTQLKETEHLFSGKTTHEKHLADVDSDIYRYTKRLKETVLPQTPSRIFILHDSQGHNLERLKTQYYLLPHNIYNFGRKPRTEHVYPGDFILVLGTVPDLRFDSGGHRLLWRSKSLPVAVVDQDGQGTLYQALATPGHPTTPYPGAQPDG